MNSQRDGIKAEIIARARHAAAQGHTDYRTALDRISFDNGFTNWEAVEVIMAKKGGGTHPKGPVGLVLDVIASLILFAGSSDRSRTRDEIASRMARPLIHATGRILRIRPSWTHVAFVMAALGLEAVACLVGMSLAEARQPAGSYGTTLPAFMLIALMIDAWLLSRAFVSSADPLRIVCRDIRANAVTLCLFRTLLITPLAYDVTGSDVRLAVVVHLMATLLSGPSIVMTMYAAKFVAETNHGE